MARFNPDHDVGPVLEAAELWKSRCLVEDGSILANGRSLWSAALLDELDRYFVRNPDASDASFFEKHLGPEAPALHGKLAAGRVPSEPLFATAGGGSWTSGFQARRFAAAAAAAGLGRDATFCSLRHGCVSRPLEPSVPAGMVASRRGPSVPMCPAPELATRTARRTVRPAAPRLRDAARGWSHTSGGPRSAGRMFVDGSLVATRRGREERKNRA